MTMKAYKNDICLFFCLNDLLLDTFHISWERNALDPVFFIQNKFVCSKGQCSGSRRILISVFYRPLHRCVDLCKRRQFFCFLIILFRDMVNRFITKRI